jgi:hypothetical protein
VFPVQAAWRVNLARNTHCAKCAFALGWTRLRWKWRCIQHLRQKCCSPLLRIFVVASYATRRALGLGFMGQSGHLLTLPLNGRPAARAVSASVRLPKLPPPSPPLPPTQWRLFTPSDSLFHSEQSAKFEPAALPHKLLFIVKIYQILGWRFTQQQSSSFTLQLL